MTLVRISRALAEDLSGLTFGPKVACVLRPLDYAWAPHEAYLRTYGTGTKEVLLLGMNPGPFGMAQTGIPFGEVRAVRDWLGISAPLVPPREVHPRRPILGFDCPRSEVSGARLWGWARQRFGTPQRFFARFFVVNYCPLLFLEPSGRNLTPDRLGAAEQARLFQCCDAALRATLRVLKPRYLIGVGRFATEKARNVLADREVTLGSIPHPSPANPLAHRDWAGTVDARLAELGILETPLARPREAAASALAPGRQGRGRVRRP